MRLASCFFSVLLAAPFSLVPSQVAAQQPHKIAPCDGMINIVRISAVNPGMMPKFLEAIAGQKAWYKKIGSSDQISVMRIMDTTSGTFSETEAITTHLSSPSSGSRPPRDADYDAFVALFRASSTIKSEFFTCVAK